MSDHPSPNPSLKQKAAHEMKRLAWVSLYIALVLVSLKTYVMLVSGNFHMVSLGTALITALVLAKVVLLGEWIHVGKRWEERPLIVPVLWKSFLFTLLVIAFHFAELFVEALIREHDLGQAVQALRHTRIDELVARGVVLFSSFIPFFAISELSRVIGANRLAEFFFRSGARTRSDGILPK